MSIKAVLVGDGACGKTTLLMTATTGQFATNLESEGPKFETKIRVVGGKERPLDFYDTFGQDENQRQRIAIYPDTDVFIVSFSIVSPYSFEHVRSKWYPELSRHAPLVPIILVGTKLDLRNDQDALERLSSRKLAPISYQQGTEMKKEIGAVFYVECSSVDGEGLPEVLQAILEVTRNKGGGKSEKKKGKVGGLDEGKGGKKKEKVVVLNQDGTLHDTRAHPKCLLL